MKSFGRYFSLLATIVALILTSISIEAQGSHRDAMVVFGDSLSDTGNVFFATKVITPLPVAIPPSESPYMTYFQGRFSNGPVGVEYFWELIKRRPANPADTVKPFLVTGAVPTIGAVNFAFGGSGSGPTSTLPGGFTVPGFLGQIGLFQTALGTRPAPQALSVIFTGANDYYGATPAQLSDPAFSAALIQQVTDNIIAGVQLLFLRGAREVMVLNLPNLGLPPSVPDVAKSLFSSVTLGHNTVLAQKLSTLQAAHPTLRLIEVDMFSFLESFTARAILTPALPLAAATCLFTPPGVDDCQDQSFDVHPSFLFWDVQHPTTATHSAFGHYLHTQLLRQQQRGSR